jgi:hypothetical protein
MFKKIVIYIYIYMQIFKISSFLFPFVMRTQG